MELKVLFPSLTLLTKSNLASATKFGGDKLLLEAW
jgi:hypothetical protein